MKPYLKGQKNEFNDAAAIAGADTRPMMRCVTIKSNEQLDRQAVRRIRDHLVGQRTAVINLIRAFLFEFELPTTIEIACLLQKAKRKSENNLTKEQLA